MMQTAKTKLSDSIYELKTFEWNNIGDPGSIGIWPGAVKLLLATLLFALCLVGGYWFHIKNLQAEFQRVAAEEVGLRSDFETKALLASNLEQYRAQMVEMQELFGDLLRQLPGRTEVPGLLEDITFTGLGSGLEFSVIQLQNEVAQEFYIELPITISVVGSFHDFGAFVSGVASLSRIVTLHDFTITAGANRSELTMQITAKTYRYNSGDEEAAQASR
ncbi:MAG: type 4a pilus biogenesis protein PilO [Dermatophilaceae bacterium]